MKDTADKTSVIGQSRFRQWQALFDAVLTLAMVAVCAVLVWALIWRAPTSQARGASGRSAQGRQQPPAPPIPTEPVSIEGVTLKGRADAPLVLIEFSEFQCPYCGKFAREVLPDLDAAYVKTGKVQVAFRHFPLPNHQYAMATAIAAACAGEQGQFWPMHDLFFADQKRLDDAAILEHATKLRVSVETFQACRSQRSDIKKRIQADESAGRSLSVTGTPAFLLGVRQSDGRVRIVERLTGAQPLDRFQAAIEKASAAIPKPLAMVQTLGGGK